MNCRLIVSTNRQGNYTRWMTYTHIVSYILIKIYVYMILHIKRYYTRHETQWRLRSDKKSTMSSLPSNDRSTQSESIRQPRSIQQPIWYYMSADLSRASRVWDFTSKPRTSITFQIPTLEVRPSIGHQSSRPRQSGSWDPGIVTLVGQLESRINQEVTSFYLLHKRFGNLPQGRVSDCKVSGPE